MPVVSRKLEKFFFIYLLLSPLMDIYGGLYIFIATKITGERLVDLMTPTLIIRMAVLLLFAWYILSLRDKKSILTITAIGAAWLATVAGEFIFAEQFSLFADMQYIAKYVYNIAILLVYWRLCQRSSWNREQLLGWFNWLFSLTALGLALGIHIPYMLGTGYSTYGDRFGYFGNRGFFYSGNDITAMLMMLTPFVIINFIKLPPLVTGRRMKLSDFLPLDKPRRRHLFYLAAPATALTALFTIATKTAFIAFGVTVITLGIYLWRSTRKSGDKQRFRAFKLVMLAFLVIFIFMSLFGLLASLAETLDRLQKFWSEHENVVQLFGSGRGEKLEAAYKQYKDNNMLLRLFGMGRGTQRFVIEMDVFEVFFYYGLAGAIAMLWLYTKLGVGLIRSFIRRVDDYGLACFLSVGLTSAYLVAAGHVLFSVSSGFYFSLMLLYSHLYFAKSTEEMELLWK